MVKTFNRFSFASFDGLFCHSASGPHVTSIMAAIGPRGGGTLLLCLACLLGLGLPALGSPAIGGAKPNGINANPSSGDSMELSEDKDLVYDDLLDHPSVVCPQPMCECRHVGSGGIAAKCSSLDFKVGLPCHNLGSTVYLLKQSDQSDRLCVFCFRRANASKEW